MPAANSTAPSRSADFLATGTSFAIRDAAGIRPGYYYFDDEVAVVSSERPAIQAAFDCTTAEVCELPPGEAMVIDRDGKVEFRPCLPPKPLRRCVFERIYFSRPNDAEIHRERRALGRKLVPAVLKEVDGDFANTLFSYIPNTAQVSFHGLLDTLNRIACDAGHTVRFGQIAVKDAKFRTFIADAASRREFYMHIYDVTYGLVRPGSDTLVALDDSIVRGNTLKKRDPADLRPARSEEDRHRLGRAADQVSGLLRHRHGQPEGARRLRGRRRPAARTRQVRPPRTAAMKTRNANSRARRRR